MAMNDDEPLQLPGPAADTRESLRTWFGVVAALTIVALALGALVGWLLVGSVPKRASSARPSVPDPQSRRPPDAVVRELAPIVTNLADPPEAWIRLQAAIVFDGKATQNVDVLAAKIGEDVLSLLRSLSLGEIGGASGLQHLREDLNERARIRSEGQVRELVIQTLVVQ